MKGLLTTVYFIAVLAVVALTIWNHINMGTDPLAIAVRAITLLYCGKELKQFIIED